MPVYEYYCHSCRRKMSKLVRGFSDTPEVVCSNCGNKKLERLFSTFAVVKTDKDVYDDILSDTSLINRMMENDPRAMLEWSRKMEGTESEKTPEYEEMVQRMDKGEDMGRIMADMKRDESASPGADSLSGVDE